MLIKLYNNNPNVNEIRKISALLKVGAVIIIPTDTVYAFACDIFQQNAVEQITKLKNHDMRRANLSFICETISQISEYAKISDEAFRILKENLPGPYTFILPGSSRLPKLFKNRKTVGIRIPDNNIVKSLVHELGNPLMVSSIFTDAETTEYATDPELIEEKYGHLVDLVIDGDYGGLTHSTIVDCTTTDFEVIRRGAGHLL